ncbi:MAG: iron-containing alcohol dehydrogenase [Oscillospiraceae bacterium]|nr:iron-containing alcohol dehydrogenase [Oscillospiraceae bacterium]
MSYFEFNNSQPTKIAFGPGGENQTGELLAGFGAKKVMITLGGGSAKRSGLLQRITESIEAAGIAYVLYEGCRANPEADWVDAGARVYKAENCDFLLAVGGGSVIDATKAIALLASNPGEHIWPYLTYEMNFEQSAAPMGVVLTIAATGSECDASFVISNGETQDKLLFTEDSTMPRFAVCNPELTYSVSPWQTACGVSDILSHLLEQYLYDDNTCTVSDEMMLGLMRSVVQWGPVAVREGENYDARANLMLSSTLAMNGLVGAGHDQNWVTHMLEHAVSAVWPDVAHGAGMACLLPCYLKLIAAHDSAGKLARFATRVFGVECDAADALRRFYTDMGLPATLRELVGREPTEEELQLVAAKSLPWGPMQAGGYPDFTEEGVAEVFRMVK